MMNSKRYMHSVPVNKAMNKSVLGQEEVEAFVQGKEGDGVAFKRVQMPFGENVVVGEIGKGDTGKKHFKTKKGKTRDYWTRDYNY